MPRFIKDAGPCEVLFEAPLDLPKGTILVHTHPYSKGEQQNHCIPGRTLEYENKPGEKDRPTLDFFKLEKGIIIDADKIIQFTPEKSEKPIINDRCGY